jgi:hypothetical protein
LGADEKMDHARSKLGASLCGTGHHVPRQADTKLACQPGPERRMRVQSTPALTERRGNAMLSSPTAMGIRGCSGSPSVTHFSISPASCQGQAAEAVAAFAVIHWRRPQAPGIFCASQFVRLQKILNTANQSITVHARAAGEGMDNL